MPKKIRLLFFLIVLLYNQNYIDAQSQLYNKVPFEIKLRSFTFNKVGNFFGDLLGNKVTPVFKFYRDSLNDNYSLHPNLCYSVTVKDKSQVFTLSENNTYGGPLTMNAVVDLNSNKEIRLFMENYQNDKGELCHFDKGDAKRKISSFVINITTLRHGVTQQPITINSDQNQYSATLICRLGLPAPLPPVCNAVKKYNDGSKSYFFKAGLNVINKDGLQLEWQGSTDGIRWFNLADKTNRDELSFIPEKDIIKSTLQSAAKCFLRYRIISPELTSDWAEQSFTVVPPAPSVRNEDIQITASCSSFNTGKISIKFINGQTNKYRIILLNGKDKMVTNCFEDISKLCPESLKDTIVASSSAVLNSIPAGDYSLLIGNANVVSDFYLANSLKIDAFPKLEISSYNATQANCTVYPSGSIDIETRGGNPDSLTFLITPVAGELIKKGRNASFGKLPENKYNVLVKDACDQVLSTPLLAIQLKDDSLKAEISIVKKPDLNKNNGIINIKMLNGSGMYSYKLFLQDNLMSTKDFSGTDLALDNLYGAKYKIQLTDKNAPKCTGWISELFLEQTALQQPSTEPLKMDTTKKNSEK
jgi:hypothetical protein